jgi:hypothetical protein
VEETVFAAAMAKASTSFVTGVVDLPPGAGPTRVPLENRIGGLGQGLRGCRSRL